MALLEILVTLTGIGQGMPVADVARHHAPIPIVALRRELISMGARDQAIRNRLLSLKDPKAQARIAPEMDRIDRANTNRLKDIVAKYGWPTRSLVGAEAAGDAFLIVQHAVADKPFMRRCLPLLLAAMDRGEVRRQDAALLVDRVLVGEGRKQWFGSQFSLHDGVLACDPIAEPERVDARRKSMGLMPLAEYEKSLREMYKNMIPRRPATGVQKG